MSKTLIDLQMTCSACPSQWEGKLADGRFVYARYRWGWLSVTAAPTLDRAVMPMLDDDEAQVLYNEQVGDEYDGVMSTEEMMRRAGLNYNE